VVGRQSGSVHAAYGRVLRVERRGVLAGSLHVSGTIESCGTRGGTEHVDGGRIQDLDGGQVRRPSIKDGAAIYL